MEDKKLESELCKVDNELEVQGYYQLEKQLESLEKSIKERVLRPKHVVPLLEQGRLLKVRPFPRKSLNHSGGRRHSPAPGGCQARIVMNLNRYQD